MEREGREGRGGRARDGGIGGGGGGRELEVFSHANMFVDVLAFPHFHARMPKQSFSIGSYKISSLIMFSQIAIWLTME